MNNAQISNNGLNAKTEIPHGPQVPLGLISVQALAAPTKQSWFVMKYLNILPHEVK